MEECPDFLVHMSLSVRIPRYYFSLQGVKIAFKISGKQEMKTRAKVNK